MQARDLKLERLLAAASSDGEGANAARWDLMLRFRDALLTRLLLRHLDLEVAQAQKVWLETFTATALKTAADALPADAAVELVVLRAILTQVRDGATRVSSAELAGFLHDELGLSVTSSAAALDCGEDVVEGWLREETGAVSGSSTSMRYGWR